MGLRHLAGFAALHHANSPARLVAICDHDEARRQVASSRYFELTGQTVRQAADLEGVLDCDDVDAVDLVLPTLVHASAAVAAMEAGRHVLVEKPMALTMRGARRMQAVAESTDRVLAVAENFRRIPGNRAFGALHAELIGTPHFTASQLVLPASALHPQGGGAWYRDRRMSGSLIALEMGVHELDLLRYWFGEIETVTGSVRVLEADAFTESGQRLSATSEDTMFVRVDFTSGVVAQITATMAGHGSAIGTRLAVGCKGNVTSTSWENWQGGTLSDDAGTVTRYDEVVENWYHDLSEDRRAQLFPPGTIDERHLQVDVTDAVRYGVAHEIDDFARSILDNRRPETDGDVSALVLGSAIAIVESAWSNSTVAVDDVVNGRVTAWQDSLVRPDA
jgi:predicted dehydrogenase